jgi:formate hydrogenlyase subunit 4
MKILIDAFQASTLILAAPLVRGTVARLKALLQKRQGATIWRPYSDLLKLFRKEELIPPTSSAVFRIAPVASFAAILSATAFIPVVHSSTLIAWRGDFFVLVYLLALGRFFLAIGALDGGSSFGGMGASREALISSLAEARFCSG